MNSQRRYRRQIVEIGISQLRWRSSRGPGCPNPANMESWSASPTREWGLWSRRFCTITASSVGEQPCQSGSATWSLLMPAKSSASRSRGAALRPRANGVPDWKRRPARSCRAPCRCPPPGGATPPPPRRPKDAPWREGALRYASHCPLATPPCHGRRIRSAYSQHCEDEEEAKDEELTTSP